MFSLLLVSPVFAQERGTRDEAVAMVNDFIAYYKEKGPVKAYAEVQNTKGRFRKKDLYIFVAKTTFDNETLVLAHGANPAIVGRNVDSMRDADGKYFFQDFRTVYLSEAKEGWVDYKWPHPVTKKVESKSTFIKKVDENIYAGCGVSE
ncbi:MAG: cache domain-containing protein [Alphaproteobacteria bacterium]